MIQKGKLPLTGKIDFDFNNDQIGLLHRKLISSFKLDGIISFPDTPSETKKKIIIYIEGVISPQEMTKDTHTIKTVSKEFKKETMYGIARTRDYLFDKILAKSCWILFGFLEGENKIPIIITFYTVINFGVYSFKKPEETHEEFNPRLN